MSYSNIHQLLKDETRRRIIEFIGRSGRVTYTDILRELGISTGKLNYHLKILAPMLDKQENQQYYLLNDLGHNAFALLQGFRPEQVSNGNALIFWKVSWVLLALSILSMYYGFLADSDSQIALGFVSSVLLISAVFLMYYSKMLVYDLRNVLILSAVAVAIGAPVSIGTSQWLFIASNPFHVKPVLNLGPSLVNSAIFYPTALAWGLRNKGRREWIFSAVIVSLATIIPVVLFFVSVAMSPNGFASLTSNFTVCTTTQVAPNITTGACYSQGNISYISLQPIFLLLTLFSAKVFPRSGEQGLNSIKRPAFRASLALHWFKHRSCMMKSSLSKLL